MFPPGRNLRLAGIAVTTIVGGAFVLRALSKYLAGDGLETYRNAKGALMNYAGAVVTAGVFVVCIAVAFIARWWHYRQERKFAEIVKAREANTAPQKTIETGS